MLGLAAGCGAKPQAFGGRVVVRGEADSSTAHVEVYSGDARRAGEPPGGRSLVRAGAGPRNLRAARERPVDPRGHRRGAGAVGRDARRARRRADARRPGAGPRRPAGGLRRLHGRERRRRGGGRRSRGAGRRVRGEGRHRSAHRARRRRPSRRDRDLGRGPRPRGDRAAAALGDRHPARRGGPRLPRPRALGAGGALRRLLYAAGEARTAACATRFTGLPAGDYLVSLGTVDATIPRPHATNAQPVHVDAGATVEAPPLDALYGLGTAQGAVVSADGGFDTAGLCVGVFTQPLLPTASTDDGGSWSLSVVCGTARVCLCSGSPCVDVPVSWRGTGTHVHAARSPRSARAGDGGWRAVAD